MNQLSSTSAQQTSVCNYTRRYSNTTFMVKPQNILSERDRINDNVVEAVAYGALNFKPANTSTKVLDYILGRLLGYSATELRNGGVTNSSKAAKPCNICSEIVVRLGICMFPTDQSNFYDTGGKIFKTSVNKLRQTGDHFLALI